MYTRLVSRYREIGDGMIFDMTRDCSKLSVRSMRVHDRCFVRTVYLLRITTCTVVCAAGVLYLRYCSVLHCTVQVRKHGMGGFVHNFTSTNPHLFVCDHLPMMRRLDHKEFGERIRVLGGNHCALSFRWESGSGGTGRQRLVASLHQTPDN